MTHIKKLFYIVAKDARRIKNIPSFQLVAIGLVYLGLISISEMMTTLGNPETGLIFHGLVLISLLLHGSLIKKGVMRRFIILLSLAPLIRILSLSIPLAKLGLPLIYWYLVIGVLLSIAAIIGSRITDLRGDRIGLSSRGWPIQLAIGLIGFGLGYIEYLILQPGPLAAYETLVDVIVASFILLIFTGVLEEYIFRGLMQSASMQAMGKFGLVYVAVLFAVLHLGYHSFVDIIFVLLVGLFFGFCVWKTHSLLGASLAHGIANISLYIFFPMLISVGSLPVASAGAALSQNLTTTPIAGSTPTAIVTPASGAITIVDNNDAGFVFVGSNLWLDDTRGFRGSFRWSYAAQAVPDVVVTWVPPLSGCGRYRVEAFIPSGIGLTVSAKYSINSRQGITSVVVNQAVAQGTWATLGIFEFEPGTSSNVRLSNETGEDPKLLRWIGYDALRWIFQGRCTSATMPPAQ